MSERWLRHAGATTQFHRFSSDGARISACGQLHDTGEVAMEGPDGFPQYFCRRCVDIKAAENRRKGGA